MWKQRSQRCVQFETSSVDIMVQFKIDSIWEYVCFLKYAASSSLTDMCCAQRVQVPVGDVLEGQNGLKVHLHKVFGPGDSRIYRITHRTSLSPVNLSQVGGILGS